MSFSEVPKPLDTHIFVYNTAGMVINIPYFKSKIPITNQLAGVWRVKYIKLKLKGF